jgi:hypothetical protein
MTMRLQAVALGLLIAAASAGALAQRYYDPRYEDPNWVSRQQAIEAQRQADAAAADSQRWRDERYRDYRDDSRWRGNAQECWNGHARHFEAVRPGEVQDDLDFSRCRPMGYGYR